MAERKRWLARRWINCCLSPRGYTRVLQVARTTADLAGATIVERVHVAGALAFRHRVPGRRKEGRGFAPDPTKGRCPLDPRKGSPGGFGRSPDLPYDTTRSRGRAAVASWRYSAR
jgi:hypothetical protein